MIKINFEDKSNLIAGAAKSNQSKIWSRYALGSVILSTGIGIITNVLNIINSSKQKTIAPVQESNAYFYSNINENLIIKLL